MKHTSTKKHQDHIQRKAEKKEQGPSDLAKDLCKMACSANLAWNVFDNPDVQEILGKHMGKKVPCGKTVSRRLDECYQEVLDKIKSDLEGHPFYVETDETNGTAGI